jgi:disulfide bond formation protein DsbB
MLAACGNDNSGGGGEVASQPTEATHAGDVGSGDAQYHQICVACHGPEGVGVAGLGKPLTTSEFLKTVNDDELLTFIKTGRPSSDPANTTGIDMPAKGGNPALSDAQIMDIIAYIRSLEK